MPFTRLPVSPGTPSSPSLPTSPWGKKRWETCHQQPSHIPDRDWGKGAAACMEMGTELTRCCRTLEMDTKAMVQSWPVKGRTLSPLQGHLSQDGGSPVGLGGLSWGDLPAPHSKTSQGSPRASKSSVFAKHRCAVASTAGRNRPPGVIPPGFSPWTTMGLTSSGSATQCPMASPPRVPSAEEDFRGTFSPLRPFRPLGPARPGDP